MKVLSFPPLCSSTVALVTAYLTLAFRVLLTTLHRTKLRGSAICALSRTPSSAGISHGYSAALPYRWPEYDLAFVRTTYLHCDVIGLALCFFVRAQAIFASLLDRKEYTSELQSH